MRARFSPPVTSCFVNGCDHLRVNDIAIFECLIQRQFSDCATQRGLRQLGDSDDVMALAIAGQYGVSDLSVQNAINLKLGVIPGDTDLAGNTQWHLFV
jgi:hypothetical protein